MQKRPDRRDHDRWEANLVYSHQAGSKGLKVSDKVNREAWAWSDTYVPVRP